MSPPIAIIGAGMSGLILGRLLEVARIGYVIFERSKFPTTQGGTLDIHAGSGQLALREAGLLDQFKKIARYDGATTLAGWDGKVYLKFNAEGDEENDRPEIDRRDLQKLILDSIPAERIRWGSQIESVRREGGNMSIHSSDGSVDAGFRLIVGADGAWSKIRSMVTPAKPQYSGFYYLSTIIRPDNPYHSSVASLVGKGNYMSFGEGKQITAMELADQTYYIPIGLRLPEQWKTEHAALLQDPAKMREFLLQEYFSEWPEVHTNMIKYSQEQIRAWPLYSMPTESLSWDPVPGVTLIGDAAHLSTPFVGEGVNCAMTDSVKLAQQIVKHGVDNIDSAIAEYEKEMFPRAIDLITRSKKSGDQMYAPDTPRGWLKSITGMDFD